MRLLLLLLLYFNSLYLLCQENFISPLKHQTVLSGSYGEPRTKHFHAGIDYKQKRGIPYDSIYAIADAIVRRISVQPDGYGNSVYLDHKNNLTSVYAHLYSFAPSIKKRIEDIQYLEKAHSIDYIALSDSVHVKQGQFIGILGSTGRSSGPHLHFEIRKTDTEIPINPALLGLKPQDDIYPTIGGIFIYTMSPDGQELTKKYYPANQISKNEYTLEKDLIIVDALLIGVGIRSYDQMNGASNHNGIYRLFTSVDGQESFSFQLDGISFDKSNYLHSHMDYHEKLNNRYVSKCFKNQGNELDIYNHGTNNGLIQLFEHVPRKVTVLVGDFEGNNSAISFKIQRSADFSFNVPPLTKGSIRIKPGDSFRHDVDDLSIRIHPNTFAQPTLLKLPQFSDDTIRLKQDIEIPVFRYLKISKIIKNLPFTKNKYTFISRDEKGVKRIQGRWENDSTLVTFVSELKNYAVAIDTIPPELSIISLPSQTGSRINFRMKDNFEPMYKNEYLFFEVLVNGDWVLCQHDIKSNTVWHDLNFTRSGAEHNLLIRCSDSSGNQNTRDLKFRY